MAVITLIEDHGRAKRRVEVLQRAHVVEALVELARTHGFPFIDLSLVDGRPISVKTDQVSQITTDAAARP